MSFATLGLAEGLLRAVADEGYSVPTPIQARAIPEILAGRDLLAAAQTGTGKTAAFTLPILHKLAAHGAPSHRRIRVLVLVPTRELAAQVDESVRTYGRHLPQIRTALIFGGVSFNPQADWLRKGVDVVVATPGRLLDHAQQRTIDLSHVEVLVLDEADRMLDMGFIHDIRRVLKLLPGKRQNLLFSATFSDDIRRLAQGLLHDPVAIDIAPRNTAVHTVAQRLVHVGKTEKAEVLSYLIRTGDWGQTLVFTRTKRGANKLAERLARDGIPTDALHGNKSQNARTRALKAFKSGEVRVLVATDIAARGLDIDQLPHVVNYELPNVPEDYVHRIGRTGRAGLEGEALSLVSPDERDELRAIERMLKQSIPVAPVNAEARQALPHTQQQRPQQPQRHQHQPRHQHPQRGQQQRGQQQRNPQQRDSQQQRQQQQPRHPQAARPDSQRTAQPGHGQQGGAAPTHAPGAPTTGGFSGRPRRKFFSR